MTSEVRSMTQWLWRHRSVTWRDLKMKKQLPNVGFNLRVGHAKFQLSIVNGSGAIAIKTVWGWHPLGRRGLKHFKSAKTIQADVTLGGGTLKPISCVQRLDRSDHEPVLGRPVDITQRAALPITQMLAMARVSWPDKNTAPELGRLSGLPARCVTLKVTGAGTPGWQVLALLLDFRSQTGRTAPAQRSASARLWMVIRSRMVGCVLVAPYYQSVFIRLGCTYIARRLVERHR